MSLPQTDRTILQTELAKSIYTGLSDKDAWEKIHNKRMVANPTPAPQILRPLAASEFASLLSSTSLAAFMASPLSNRILDAIDAQDRLAIGIYANALAGASPAIITDAEKISILSYLTSMIPDPDWPTEIEAPSARDNIFPADHVWEVVPTDGPPFYTNFIPLEFVTEVRA